LLHALLLPINISKIVQLVRKNRFDARVAHLLRASGEDRTVDCVPFPGPLSSRNGLRAFDQTTREPRPSTS
jgi:hypothetical protein